jgi:hypothetical protein
LKTWPPFFQLILDGEKTFELRENDRGFKTGDYLVLEEYTPDNGYTGRVLVHRVGVIVEGEWGLKPGVCAMSLLPV